MSWEYIAIFVIAGFVSIFFELFIPGGILGTLGIILLLSAIGAAYGQYGLDGAAYVLLGEIGLGAIGFYLWARFFPGSRWGKRIAVQEVIEDEEFRHNLDHLNGKDGLTVSLCRPAGTVEIEGKRYDVVSEGALIQPGAKVTVVQVEGRRVVVRPR
ncbi:MAG: NfeD family protein [Verrucomicrobiota bacterium]